MLEKLNPTRDLYRAGCQSTLKTVKEKGKNVQVKVLVGTNRAYLIAMIPVGIVEISIRSIWATFTATINTLSFHSCFKNYNADRSDIIELIDLLTHTAAFAIVDPELVFASVEYVTFGVTRNSKGIIINQDDSLKEVYSNFFSDKMMTNFENGEIKLTDTFKQKTVKLLQRQVCTRGYSLLASISASGEAFVRGTVIGAKLSASLLKFYSYEDKLKLNDLTKWALCTQMSVTAAFNVLWNIREGMLIK